MRFWNTEAWQACKVGECVNHGDPFPDYITVGEIHEMPVYVPSAEELAAVGLKRVEVSADAANAKVAISRFRKRVVSERGVLFSKRVVWERVA